MGLTLKFNEIYNDYTDFSNDSKIYLAENYISADDLELLYVLFYNQFAEQSIKFLDPILWKRRFWTKLAFKAKTLLKKRDLMDKLRELTEDEMLDKGVSVVNQAMNPNTKPGEPFQVLDFVTTQTSAKNLNPKIVALLQQYQSMDDGFWNQFFKEFDDDLFLQVFGGADCEYIEWEDE